MTGLNKSFLSAAYERALTTAGTRFARLFLYVFSFFESIIIPIPTDPLLAACTHAKPQQWKQIALYCALASVAGGAVGWYLGAFAETYVMALIDQLPHAVMNEEKFNKVAVAFQKVGLPLVLIGAFTPLPFKVIAISAGLFGYPLASFVVIATIGRIGRFLLVGAIVRYHRNGRLLTSLITAALLLILVAFWMIS